jgi:hypothetical protein
MPINADDPPKSLGCPNTGWVLDACVGICSSCMAARGLSEIRALEVPRLGRLNVHTLGTQAARWKDPMLACRPTAVHFHMFLQRGRC